MDEVEKLQRRAIAIVVEERGYEWATPKIIRAMMRFRDEETRTLSTKLAEVTAQRDAFLALAVRRGKERDEAREALRPFAKVAYDIITNRPDDEVLADGMAAERLTWGDLRKARATLTKKGSDDGR